MYASFSFCPPDLPPESAYVSYSLSSSRNRSEAVNVYQFRTSVTCRVHFWSASVSPSRPLNRSMIRFTCRNFCSEYWSSPVPLGHRVVGAGPQVGAEVPDLDVRGLLRFEPDVPARVVVHVEQGAVDRVDPLPDQVGLPDQLGLELGDLADRVLVQVRLELVLEAGQVVVREPLVQLTVAVAASTALSSSAVSTG